MGLFKWVISQAKTGSKIFVAKVTALGQLCQLSCLHI